MSQASVTLDTGLQAKISIRQFELLSDEPVDAGGDDLAPSPPEMMLGALGACGAITAKLYAQRKGWDLLGVEIELEMERVDPAEYPAVVSGSGFLHRIRKHFRFRGDLSDEQKNRLVEIANKCPVARVLQNPVVFEDTIVTESQA
jgi:putative redox protein